MHKKDLPLAVLQTIEPIVKLKDDRFIIEKNENMILSIRDADSKSNFMFQIIKYEYDNGVGSFTVNCAPKNDKDVAPFSKIVREGYLVESFNNWLKSVEGYDLVRSVFDDPVLQAYEAEFYSNFEFVDEDAEIRPFRTTQILQLDHFLEQVNNRLIEMTDENNRESIETIILEIDYVRDNLATRSQKWVAENVSKIFAKIAKQGAKFMKEFWSEGRKEIIKEIVKIAIAEGVKRLHQ